MASLNSSVLISQIYKSRQIVLQLMEKQGYDVTGYANFSPSEVNAMKQNNQLDMLLEMKKETDSNSTTNNEKVYIRYYLAKTIRPANLQEMIDDLFTLSETLKKSDTLYIIIKDHVNDTMLNELKHIWERDKIFIVIESIKNLQFNILNHVLVPQHIKMTPAEIHKTMQKYNITELSQMPDISRFDPVARAICLRPGQVCHIIRPSKTAIEADYFRVCI
jgi:DNA-directed RNA polymerase subunit H